MLIKNVLSLKETLQHIRCRLNEGFAEMPAPCESEVIAMVCTPMQEPADIAVATGFEPSEAQQKHDAGKGTNEHQATHDTTKEVPRIDDNTEGTHSAPRRDILGHLDATAKQQQSPAVTADLPASMEGGLMHHHDERYGATQDRTTLDPQGPIADNGHDNNLRALYKPLLDTKRSVLALSKIVDSIRSSDQVKLHNRINTLERSATDEHARLAEILTTQGSTLDALDKESLLQYNAILAVQTSLLEIQSLKQDNQTLQGDNLALKQDVQTLIRVVQSLERDNQTLRRDNLTLKQDVETLVRDVHTSKDNHRLLCEDVEVVRRYGVADLDRIRRIEAVLRAGGARL